MYSIVNYILYSCQMEYETLSLFFNFLSFRSQVFSILFFYKSLKMYFQQILDATLNNKLLTVRI